jgi:hypothetical protein
MNRSTKQRRAALRRKIRASIVTVAGYRGDLRWGGVTGFSGDKLRRCGEASSFLWSLDRSTLRRAVDTLLASGSLKRASVREAFS